MTFTLAGQATEGSLLGTVTRPSGAPVPNARVLVLGESTGLRRTRVTNGSGEYVAVALPAGLYTVSVEQPGFKSIFWINVHRMLTHGGSQGTSFQSSFPVCPGIRV